ncbi:MAG: acyl carrier protein [Panacagrimonas sp.]|jgi:acyl carrier protein|nr:phosphopantetheine-binding protein [Panacagrimonas sp.]MCC2657811.1 acyl carrier protein [Panacagrimonas sp.]
MSVVADAEREMAHLLVTALHLEAVDAEQLDPDTPLFGTAPGSLALDSIDALEIALAVQRKYGIELRAQDQVTGQIFASLRALSAHVQRCRVHS